MRRSRYPGWYSRAPRSDDAMQTVAGLDITHGECIEMPEVQDENRVDRGGRPDRSRPQGTPFYEAKWRDGRKRQRKRRLGRAWLEPDPRGGWKRRRGRVCRGYLDERSAYREMARVIGEVEAEQQIAPTKREARFEDAVQAWFAHLEFEKRAKPSTLAGYRNPLAPPRPGDRGQRGARIMREFAGASSARSRPRTSSVS